LRTGAYALVLDGSAGGLVGSFDGLNVYFYMAVQSLFSGGFLNFYSGWVFSRAGLSCGLKIDKKSAVLYLDFFIISANIIAGLVGLLFIAYPYIFINYTIIITFFIRTVGYTFLAYFFTRRYISKRSAPRFFSVLAVMYFGLNIGVNIIFYIMTGTFL
jgi:hypothetical protein